MSLVGAAALVWLCQAAPAPAPDTEPPPAAALVPAPTGPAAPASTPTPTTTHAPTPPPGPSVLLWPELGSSASTGQEEALAQALTLRVPTILRSTTITASPATAERERADGEDLGRVEAALAAARKAYLGFEFEGARAEVDRLLAEDLGVLSRPGQTTLLGEALRLAAGIALAAGRSDAARGHAGSASFVLAEGAGRGVPPEYARLESDVRGESQRTARRPLRVASTPAGALVDVDGRRAGATPITIDVAPGDHVVRLEAAGRKVAAALVAVGPEGGSLEAELLVDPDDAVLLRRIARGTLDPDDAASRRALLARAGASHLVTYRATFDGVRAAVLPLAADRPAVVVEAARASALAARLADAVLGPPGAPLSAGGGTGAGAAGLAAGPAADDAPAYTRWWFWTAAAIVVGGVSTAALLYANRPAQHAIVRPR